MNAAAFFMSGALVMLTISMIVFAIFGNDDA